jgi:hypothetical protein
MTAGELRSVTCAGGLVWSASPVWFITEDGLQLSVMEHRVSQCSEVTDTGLKRMTGIPILTLVMRVDGVAGPHEPVKDALGNPLVGAEASVAGGVTNKRPKVTG